MTKAVNETLIERRKPRGPRDERERERLSETLIERREERYREVKKRERERERERESERSVFGIPPTKL